MVRIVCIVMALCLAAPAAAAGPTRPRGEYSGGGDQALLSVSGDTMPLAAFGFHCRPTDARTSLNGVAIKKQRGRYRFATKAYVSITYADDVPDENGRMELKGTFSRDAKRVTGTFRVTAKHCGSTGRVTWSARRKRG